MLTSLALPRVRARTCLFEDTELVGRELRTIDSEERLVLGAPAEHVVEQHLDPAVGELPAAGQPEPRPGLHSTLGTDAQQTLGGGGANPAGIFARE